MLILPHENVAGFMALKGSDPERLAEGHAPDRARRPRAGARRMSLAPWEAAQVERANSSGRTPVLFIHGLWLTGGEQAHARQAARVAVGHELQARRKAAGAGHTQQSPPPGAEHQVDEAA